MNNEKMKVTKEPTALSAKGNSSAMVMPELFEKNAWLNELNIIPQLVQGMDESDQLCANNDSETIQAFCEFAKQAAEHPEQCSFFEMMCDKVEQVNIRAHESNRQKKELFYAVFEKVVPLAVGAFLVWGEITGKFKVSKFIDAMVA